MRYSHPNKVPRTPMYYWIERTYEKHRIELENMLELSAIHWYELYKEKEKYFQATPIRLFWESMKEQFPEAYIDTGLLPKTIVEVEENNKQLRAENDQLRAENERLREGLQKIYNLVNDSNTEYAVQLVITMQDEAQQTLNEDYEKQIRNIPEIEYRKITEGKWSKEESEVKE